MNSFRFPRTPRSAVLSASLLAIVAGAALLPGRAAAQVPVPHAQMLPPQGLVVDDGSSGAAIKLPQGASIEGASRDVQALAAEAGKSLDALVGESAVGRDKALIDELSARKRRIMLLKDQLEEAKLAKQIWQELHGDEGGENEEVKRLEEENRSLQAALTAAQQAPQRQAAESDEALPVVSSIDGAADVARAVILVPYVGIVRAETGSLLPNGMKVVSISKQGVVVEQDGKRRGLAFGGAVPMQRKTTPGVPMQ